MQETPHDGALVLEHLWNGGQCLRHLGTQEQVHLEDGGWTLLFHEGAGYLTRASGSKWCKDVLEWGFFASAEGHGQVVHRKIGKILGTGWELQHAECFLPIRVRFPGDAKPLSLKAHVFKGAHDGCKLWWELWQIQQLLFGASQRPSYHWLQRHWPNWNKMSHDLGLPCNSMLKARPVAGRFSSNDAKQMHSDIIPEATASTCGLVLWLASMPHPRGRAAAAETPGLTGGGGQEEEEAELARKNLVARGMHTLEALIQKYVPKDFAWPVFHGVSDSPFGVMFGHRGKSKPASDAPFTLEVAGCSLKKDQLKEVLGLPKAAWKRPAFQANIAGDLSLAQLLLATGATRADWFTAQLLAMIAYMIESGFAQEDCDADPRASAGTMLGGGRQGRKWEPALGVALATEQRPGGGQGQHLSRAAAQALRAGRFMKARGKLLFRYLFSGRKFFSGRSSIQCAVDASRAGAKEAYS